MSGPHVVAAGECLSSIAFAHGFFWQTLWDHPDNAELKARRGDAFSLQPGDVVQIPELRAKQAQGATGNTHRFRRKGVPAKLRVQVLDHLGQPRAGVPYRLSVEGTPLAEGATTDADGWVEHYVSPAARSAELVVGVDADDEITYALQLGGARPHDTPQGIADRLCALGFLHADDDTSDALARAIEDFQVAHDLPPTGKADAATTTALRDAYGG